MNGVHYLALRWACVNIADIAGLLLGLGLGFRVTARSSYRRYSQVVAYDVFHEAATVAAPLYGLHTRADHDVVFVLALHGSTSLARGQHGLFEPILQRVPRYTATCLVLLSINYSL